MRLRSASQGGFSLATTLIIVALVGGIASALIILSSNQMSVDQKTRDKVRATYLAEAGVEQLAHLLRKALANSVDLTIPDSSRGVPLVVDGKTLSCQDLKRRTTLPNGGFQIDSTALGADGEAETVTTETLIDHNLIALTAERFLQRPPLPATDPAYDALEAQTTTILYSLTAELRYIARRTDETGVSVDDTLRRVKSGTLGRVVRVLEYKVTPIFDKFAFWNGDLEILPGPNAIFNGRIHTNANLYIGSGGGLDINTDYIRANGDMFRHRLDNPGGSSTNYVRIRDPYADPYSATGKLGNNPWEWRMEYESNSTYNSSWDMDTNWMDQVSNNPTLNGKVRNNDTDAGGLLLEPPEIDSIQVNGHYYNTADIIVRDTTVYRKTGSNPDGSPILTDITSTLPAGTVTSSTVYDARESADGSHADPNGSNVPVTVIDMEKLGSAGFPPNGVLYAYRTRTAPATSTSPRVIEGIQLSKGKTLPGNLTFVTNGPAYVQGDFNVDVAADPVAGTPANPRKGAAVMADAVNLLSNAWNNTKTRGSSAPTASNTTYNFALVTGNVPTRPGQSYSGGLENLPRFHENWAGKDMKYQGSLMSLFESKIAIGRWGTRPNVYSPPNRRWDFDANFGNPDSPAQPPLFPQTVSISRTTYTEGYLKPVP